MKISTLLRLTLIWMATFAAQQVWATKTVFVPAFCEPKDLMLRIQNLSAEPQMFWIQRQVQGDLLEKAYELHARETLSIPGDAILDQPESLSFKTHSELGLKFKVNCEGQAAPVLSDFVTPQVSHYLPTDALTVKLWLLNLSLEPQSVFLRFLSSTGEVLDQQEVQLKNYYDTFSDKISVPNNTQRLEILGAHRLHSWVAAQTSWNEVFVPGIAVAPAPLAPAPDATYFLVSTKDAMASESFVIQITEPEMIAKAREQIHSTGFPKIVVARIQVGDGGFNRSFHRHDRAPFSWSVSHVDALADFAHIDCDGSPEIIEERLQQRLNEGGRICFWRYRVVRELSSVEVQKGLLAKP